MSGNPREERERTTLAMVVGPQRNQHVFERHDYHQGPEDQAENTEYVQIVHG